MKIDRDGWVNLDGVSISIGVYAGMPVVVVMQHDKTELVPIRELAKSIPMYEEFPEDAVNLFDIAIQHGALS